MIVGISGGPSDLILTDDGLPSMFRSADAASLASSADTVRWSALQLAMWVAGAVLGGIDVHLGNGLDLGALIASIALLASLVPAVWLSVKNPQRVWYRGRAAAESLRTLSWKYAVRAEPFAGTDETANERLLSDLRDVGWRHRRRWPSRDHRSDAAPAQPASPAATTGLHTGAPGR